jgi:hypothetical protein
VSECLRCCLLSCVAGLLPASAVLAAEDLSGLVDPTAPLNMTVVLDNVDRDSALLPLLESYTLNSVLIRNNDRVAVVNGQRARIGDRVGSARVSRIDQDGVVLVVNGETRVLSLYGEPVKTLVVGEKQ